MVNDMMTSFNDCCFHILVCLHLFGRVFAGFLSGVKVYVICFEVLMHVSYILRGLGVLCVFVCMFWLCLVWFGVFLCVSWGKGCRVCILVVFDSFVCFAFSCFLIVRVVCLVGGFLFGFLGGYFGCSFLFYFL